MNKPTKPEALIVKEAREMLVSGFNYVIQETGISMIALEPIVKDLYNEVAQNATHATTEAEKRYQEELKAYEKAQIPTKPATETPKETEIIDN